MTTIETRVVTYQDGGGFLRIDICPECAAELRARNEWPRTPMGAEYCQVRMGLHRSDTGCAICSEKAASGAPA